MTREEGRVYYEEDEIDGVLCYRTHPQGQWVQLTAQEGRVERTEPMTWSMNRPTVEGWYWFRPTEPVNEYRILPGVQMVYVSRAGERLFMGNYAIALWDGTWSGPLEPPVEVT